MRSTAMRVLLLAMIVSVVALPAPSLGGAVRVKATADKTWNPAFKSVPKGTKVIWKNPTGTKHTVTSYSSNWSKDTTIKAGERTSKIFRSKGAFYYRCKIHSSLDAEGTCAGMCGHIHVT